MSQENQSCLRFSLEESLWFRKGQEVAELVSVSLDPDITIQENDQYVTIRGSLELTGEYKSYDDIDAEEQEELAKHQKYVERVDPQEEGLCEFSHRFPVDITIPNNRIQSIYDIDVIVESFDYAFPERSCLKLTAELMISGLYDSKQEQQQEQGLEVNLAVEEETFEEEQEYEILHRFKAVTEEEEGEQQEDLEEEQEDEEPILFESEARKQKEEEPVAEFPKFPTFTYQEADPVFLQETRSEAAQPEEEQVIDLAEEAPVEEPVAEQEQPQEEEVVEESSSSPDESPKHIFKKKASKKKTMTLTEFFARKEENAEQARLKMCIVQKGDTIDSLADRYDVSVLNLLKVNNLELNQDVYEGQVLYVPAAMAKK
nr:stage VI sporulation protein D [Neobacillus sp. Marseille-Q6967]